MKFTFFVVPSRKTFCPPKNQIFFWLICTVLQFISFLIQSACRSPFWAVFAAVGFVFAIGHYVVRSAERELFIQRHGTDESSDEDESEEERADNHDDEDKDEDK